MNGEWEIEVAENRDAETREIAPKAAQPAA
jgi:hypothetical protein